MAAIVCRNCDLTALHRHLEQRLPDYARPAFLRVRKDIEVTATFKQKKGDLVREGFDPTLITDPLYFNDPQTRSFVPIDKPLYDLLQSGQVRL